MYHLKAAKLHWFCYIFLLTELWVSGYRRKVVFHKTMHFSKGNAKPADWPRPRQWARSTERFWLSQKYVVIALDFDDPRFLLLQQASAL